MRHQRVSKRYSYTLHTLSFAFLRTSRVHCVASRSNGSDRAQSPSLYLKKNLQTSLLNLRLSTRSGVVEQTCQRRLMETGNADANTNFTTMTLTLDRTNAVARAVKIAGDHALVSRSHPNVFRRTWLSLGSRRYKTCMRRVCSVRAWLMHLIQSST